MNKTLIADYHPIVGHGLKTLLQDDERFEVIDTIQDGADLFPYLENNEVNLLILEIDIPNLNSLTSVKTLKQSFPKLKIIVYSCHPEDVYALSAIKYGASGFISKTAGLDRVREAMIMAAKGGMYLNDSLSESLVNYQHNQSVLAMRYKDLSSREMEVLNLIAKGNRNKEIAQALDINEKTVSTYKMRLLKKLNAANVAELTRHTRLLYSEAEK